MTGDSVYNAFQQPKGQNSRDGLKSWLERRQARRVPYVVWGWWRPQRLPVPQDIPRSQRERVRAFVETGALPWLLAAGCGFAVWGRCPGPLRVWDGTAVDEQSQRAERGTLQDFVRRRHSLVPGRVVVFPEVPMGNWTEFCLHEYAVVDGCFLTC